MINKNLNLIICGIGGQGIVLTSDIVSRVFLHSNYDIKATDIIGLGQRGGSVVTHIRVGQKIDSPLIKNGEADVILAFEKYEGLRWISYLKKEGIVIINDHKDIPTSVLNGLQEDIDLDGQIDKLNFQKIVVSGRKILKDHGINNKFTNLFMTGIFSRYTGIREVDWEKNILDQIPSTYAVENIRAFRLGRNHK